MLTITIPNERAPSWNKMYAGMHWSKRVELAQTIWWKVYAAMPHNAKMFDVPVDVSIVATYKGRIVDSDNVVGKIFIDAIKGKLIRDDDPRYVRRVTTESKHGKHNSVTIQLTPVEDAK